MNIVLFLCKEVDPGDCTVEYEGTQYNTSNSRFLASEYFRDYVLEVFFVESSHEIANLEKPLKKNLRRLELRFDSSQKNYQLFRLSQVSVESTSGTFKSRTSSETGLFLQTNFNTKGSLDPNEPPYYFVIDGVETETPNTIEYIDFELSNQIIDVVRTYPTVVTLFQRIGGVAQIFIFIFVYLMIINNEVVVELYLLNNAVLRQQTQ